MNRLRRRGKVGLKTVGAVVGVVLSIALISTVFFRWRIEGGHLHAAPRFTLAEFTKELPQQIRWLIPFALLTALTTVLRAVQWQTTLKRKVPFAPRYHLVAIAGIANNLIPGKLGDAIRAYLLARREQLPFVESLGSVLVCKLLELAALMVLVALSFLGPLGRTLREFTGAVEIALAVCLALTVLVVVTAHHAQPLARKLEARRRFPKLRNFLHDVGEGVGTAKSLKAMLIALLASAGPVIAPALGYGLGLASFGVHDGVLAGASVLGVIALGQSVAGPAGMGAYYVVTAWAARALGATPEQAAAYALFTHLGTVLPQVLLGAISLAVEHMGLRDLRTRGSSARDEARHLHDRPQEA